jgi:hypothetical protein
MDIKARGRNWGATAISELLTAGGIRGVFFLASNEKYLFGDRHIASLARKLTDAGHEVGIHSHPEWEPTAKGRILMSDFTLQEQAKILRHMIDDLSNWTGIRPISHRAGGYGANLDTLKALRDNAIEWDSSAYSGNQNCQVPGPKNLVRIQLGVVEVPVTGYQAKERLRLGPLRIPLRRRFLKTDLADTPPSLILSYIREASLHNIEVVNLFLHSYSLIEIHALPNIRPNWEALRNLENVCSIICRPPIVKNVCTFHDLIDAINLDAGEAIQESIPHFSVDITPQIIIRRMIYRFGISHLLRIS